VCVRCRKICKSCQVNGIGHRALQLKVWAIWESSEEVGNPKTPVKAKIPLAEVKLTPVAGPSGGNGVLVWSGVLGNGGVVKDLEIAEVMEKVGTEKAGGRMR
jgi:hypothetical protein